MEVNMAKIDILIDYTDNFAACPQNGDIACISTGRTLDEVKANIVSALEFHRDGLLEDGIALPEELQGDIVPVFHLSTRAQLKYTDRYITRKALARETGIAEQQLSHYANGLRHPRPAMQQRIADGIRAISQRLLLIF